MTPYTLTKSLADDNTPLWWIVGPGLNGMKPLRGDEGRERYEEIAALMNFAYQQAEQARQGQAVGSR